MNPRENRALNVKRTRGKRLRCDFPSEVLQALTDELLPHIQAWLEKLVAEEVNRKFSTLGSPWSEIQISGSSARTLHLEFKTNPATRVFTETNLEDEHGDPICVRLIDAHTRQPVTTGLESAAKLEVVPLMGDFNAEEWTAEEFGRHVAKEREGKGPLLVGDLEVDLNEGVASLKQMYFTDNSSFTRSKRFRLGVRVAHEQGIMSVREGKSESFSVRDSRGKAYMKHDTPSPTDEVWRLKNIGKDGAYHTRLEQVGIKTVEDFLATRPQYLREVLVRMTEKQFEATVDHAKRCVLSDKLYVYPVEQSPYESVIFAPNCQVLGAVAEGRYVGLETVHGSDMELVDHLVKSAYEHWETDVTEFTVEEHAEPSMNAPPVAVDGLLDDNLADVVVGPQEAAEATPGAEGAPSLELTTGEEYEEGDAIEQELISGDERIALSEMESWTADHDQQLWPEIRDDIASQVQYVVDEELLGVPPFADAANPAGNKWWLRIRSVVRCALFMRRAAFARSPP